jgi:hypothetical protein
VGNARWVNGRTSTRPFFPSGRAPSGVGEHTKQLIRRSEQATPGVLASRADRWFKVPPDYRKNKNNTCPDRFVASRNSVFPELTLAVVGRREADPPSTHLGYAPNQASGFLHSTTKIRWFRSPTRPTTKIKKRERRREKKEAIDLGGEARTQQRRQRRGPSSATGVSRERHPLSRLRCSVRDASPTRCAGRTEEGRVPLSRRTGLSHRPRLLRL